MKAKIEIGKGVLEQLAQLTTVTFDGNLLCKEYRNKLVKSGHAIRYGGYNVITPEGIKLLDALGTMEGFI